LWVAAATVGVSSRRDRRCQMTAIGRVFTRGRALVAMKADLKVRLYGSGATEASNAKINPSGNC
jgi:hypothetical protein